MSTISSGSISSSVPISYPPLNQETYETILPIIANAFRSDPIALTLIAEVDSLLPKATPADEQKKHYDSASLERAQVHFAPLVHDVLTSGTAFVVEAGEWNAVALWKRMDPADAVNGNNETDKRDRGDDKVDSIAGRKKRAEEDQEEEREREEEDERVRFPVDGSPRSALTPTVTTAKLAPLAPHPAYSIPLSARVLRQFHTSNNNRLRDSVISSSESCYCLYILVRNTLPCASGSFSSSSSAAANAATQFVPGAISATVRPVLEQARRENKKVWLQSTSERSMQIYKRWGFRVVGTWTLDVNGGKQGGGPMAWIMVWEP